MFVGGCGPSIVVSTCGSLILPLQVRIIIYRWTEVGRKTDEGSVHGATGMFPEEYRVLAVHVKNEPNQKRLF